MNHSWLHTRLFLQNLSITDKQVICTSQTDSFQNLELPDKIRC